MKNSNLIYRYLTVLFVATMYANEAEAEMQQIGIPRLVVNVTIDQLRSDYLEAFSSLYLDGGFNRLLKEGRVYADGINNFAPADRASATATISTGTTPYYNGVVAGSWLDRATLRPVLCTDDKKVEATPGTAKASARRLLTSTIGDELKRYTHGAAKVFGIAPDCDAAILSAGHAADGAVWIDDNTGAWITTGYYVQPTNHWITNFARGHQLANIVADAKWTPMVNFSTSASFFVNQGTKNSFTHKFTGNRRFVDYKRSALINADITDIALACQQSNNLGADDITDLLSIQYYAGFFSEGNLSESQLELQDTYLRLDKEMQRLMEVIERRVGKNNVIFVVSSTGYCLGDNSDYEKYNIPSGTFYINRTANLLNMFLSSIYGTGQYVDACYHNHIYLNHKLLERQHISIADVSSRALEFLQISEGVRDVHTTQSILSSSSGDVLLLRNAYNPTLLGDIVIEVAPGWQLVNEDTGETYTQLASTVSFPIIFFGKGIEAERITGFVTTDRIAPTITKTIRIRAPNGCRSLPLF